MGMKWAEWWKNNSDKVLQTRRKRYAEDELFREKQKEISRRDWIRKSRMLAEKRKQQLLENKKSIKIKKHLSPKRLTLDNVSLLVHPISKLSIKIGKSSAYIKRLAIKGILPKPTFIDKYNRFWYSDTYINEVGNIFLDCRSDSWSLDKFRDALKEKLKGYEW